MFVMYTIKDIYNLIRAYHDAEICDIMTGCDNCNLYKKWCKMDSYMLSYDYITNGEYYG